MKVLHITNWYPNSLNSKEAIWIKNHINSLPSEVESKVLHFEVFTGKKLRIRKTKSSSLDQYLISLPFENWLVFEWIHFCWLFYQLIVRRRYKNYDIINFHIAYPMLTYWHLIKKWIRIPVVITEHWSAYHFNFGVKKTLPRIQRIFRQNIPVITVSNSLSNDLKNFSNAEFSNYIIPNVVNSDIFYHEEKPKRERFLFMVSQWKSPKNPFLVFEAFLGTMLCKNYELIVGGYGPQWEDMKIWLSENDHNKKIRMVGTLQSQEIANYMRKCKAFLHPSEYETFSVVCAEAICCGALVVASNVGAIPEVVGENGILVKENSINSWTEAINEIENFRVETQLDNKFSKQAIGEKYSSILIEIVYG